MLLVMIRDEKSANRHCHCCCIICSATIYIRWIIAGRDREREKSGSRRRVYNITRQERKALWNCRLWEYTAHTMTRGGNEARNENIQVRWFLWGFLFYRPASIVAGLCCIGLELSNFDFCIYCEPHQGREANCGIQMISYSIIVACAQFSLL